jgi:hypothetical protein
VTKSNRAEGRKALVSGGDPPRCPECGGWLGFGTDRQGRAVQSCDCGFKGYVQLRSGSIPTQGPAMPPVIVPLPVKVVPKSTPWPGLKVRSRPKKK